MRRMIRGLVTLASVMGVSLAGAQTSVQQTIIQLPDGTVVTKVAV